MNVFRRYRAMRQALELIGTQCETFLPTPPFTCWTTGRIADAEYTAERWCDHCIARAGLTDGLFELGWDRQRTNAATTRSELSSPRCLP